MADKKNKEDKNPAIQDEDQSKEKDIEEVLPDEQAETTTDENAESVSESEEVTEPELSEEERLSKRVVELEDKLLRSAAEFENYKKRMAHNYENLVQSASENILTEILGIVDNFERAFEHNNENTDFEAFKKGTELILNQMIDLLKKHNVTPIVALGEKFDPNLHEALMQVPSDEQEDGIVAMEISKGYRYGQRVLRHAKVGVSSGKSEKSEKSEKDEKESDS
ncbi:MAG: nucleotide exchange factor GrpE [candidate division Zixibacteria bacterium]|nr:nucleotide exchange factor GrpE [candidate division Zixibacteria bacterium]